MLFPVLGTGSEFAKGKHRIADETRKAELNEDHVDTIASQALTAASSPRHIAPQRLRTGGVH